MDFAKRSVEVALPTEMTLGGRTYEVLDFPVVWVRLRHGVVAYAKELRAHLGREHREYVLEHRGEIPPAFFDKKAIFIFTDDRDSECPDWMGCVAVMGEGWAFEWDLGYDCRGHYFILRPKESIQ